MMWSSLCIFVLATAIELQVVQPHTGENNARTVEEEPTRYDGKTASNLAFELGAQITQEEKEISTGMINANEENNAGMTTELTESQTNLDEMSADSSKRLQEVKAQQQEVLDLLQGEMRMASQKEFDRYKEMATVQNEVKTMVKDVSKNLDRSQIGLETELTRLHATSNRFTADLAGQVARAAERQNQAAANIDETVKSTLAKVKINSDEQTDALMEKMEKKTNVLQNEMTGVEADLNSARVKTTRELDGALGDSLAKEQAVSAELESIGAETGQIREMSNRQNDETTEKLNQATEEVKLQLKESQTVFSNTKTNVIEGMHRHVDDSQEINIANMDKKKKRVQAELNDKLAMVEQGVAKSTAGVQKTTELVEQGVKDLNNEIADNRNNTIQTTEKLDNLQEHLKSTQFLVNHQMNQTIDTTHQSLESVMSYVQNQLSETKEQLKTTSDEAAAKTSSHLATVKDTLDMKIKVLQINADQSAALLSKSAQSAESKAESLLSHVQKVETDVSKEKKTVGEAIPHVKAAVDAAVTQVMDTVNNVDSQLKSSKETVENGIEDTTAKLTEDEKQQVKDVSNTLRKELKGSANEVSTSMGGMLQSLQELKSETTKKYHQADEAQARMRSSLSESIARAGKEADESEIKGQSLEAVINKASTGLASEEKTTQRKTRALAQHLGEVVQSDIQDAESKGSDTMRDSITKSNDQLKSFEQQADADIQGDETKLGAYISDASSKLAGFSSKVNNLGSDLEKREQATEVSNEGLAKTMDEIHQNQVKLEAKSEAAVGKEKGIIEQRGKDLSQLINEKVEGMTKSQDARMSEMERQTKTVFTEEATREELEQGKVTATVNQWQHRMQSQLQGIEKSVESSKSELAGYNSAEATDDTRFQKEVTGLGKEINAGQQRVTNAVQAEDSRVGGLMDGELKGMDSLLGAVKATQNQFAQQVNGMKKSFSRQLDDYTTAGDAKAKSLTTTIERLEDTARDVSSGFQEDSRASAAQLAHTKTRLNTLVTDTSSQMDRFESQIDEVRSRRSKEAAAIQHQTDALKNELAQQKSATDKHIESVTQETSSKFTALGKKQKSYDKKLDSMVQESSTHEGALIEAMKDKINELEASNERLTDWQGNFKKRTLSWRQEVERRVHEINSAPGAHAPNLRSAESLLETSSQDQETEKVREEAVKLMQEKKSLSTDSASLEDKIAKLQDKLSKNGLVAL